MKYIMVIDENEQIYFDTHEDAMEEAGWYLFNHPESEIKIYHGTDRVETYWA